MSQSRAVILPGVLRGMGHEVQCNVSARLVSLPNDNTPPVYTKLDVSGEPANLPDGLYELTFAGQTASYRRKQGLWEAP